ncbi:tetratricopeptide repeat protein [Polynucleobacter sp. MWH-UH24A]|uniref:tetratricopeptide repeat protein n=1 Tax=Polynucleobacter sp. MWH-UH24A TaxID=2689110 RepID=UPI001BFE97CF|nr:tetratricopeptide repeat protein [Polynucleobacter sp. MWH-UH24A]QWD76226.1 tetratricopeptide repeat protein [Polynucleobacter sp. MWH-UH24A]
MNLNSVIQLHQKGQFDLAEKHYKKLLKINKNNIDLLFLLGLLYAQTNKTNSAIIQFEKVLSIELDHLPSLYNLSIAYIENGKPEFAIKNLSKCIDLDGENHKNYLARADAYIKIGKFLNAKSDVEKSISISPLDFSNYTKRAYIYEQEGKYLEAIKDLKTVLVSELNLDELNFNIGNLYAKINDHSEAISHYLTAIDQNNIKPEFYLNLANSYAAVKNFKMAIQNYRKAYDLNSNLKYLKSSYTSCALSTCSWDDFSKFSEKYEQDMIAGFDAPIFPSECLIYINDPEIQRIITSKWLASKNIIAESSFKLATVSKDKISVGYFSGDFRNHAVTHLISNLIELHDRSRFNIYGFSYGENTNDIYQQRIFSAFDGIFDIKNLNDFEVIDLTRNLKIDIAIDLSVFTIPNRHELFIKRVAPIQINYLGYPGTSCIPNMDYIIADPFLIPNELQKFYSEKIIYLPETYQPNDSAREINYSNFDRKYYGLPSEAIVYCCFNQTTKISKTLFKVWMEILDSVDNSVLWLLCTDDFTKYNLLCEANKNNINPNRLIFAEFCDHKQHLERYKMADLFLDTYPYNAHTTASDSLWNGIPVISLYGNTFASRVGLSLLNAVDLPFLAVNTLLEYKNLAISLGKNPNTLTDLKRKLIHVREESKLFDTKNYVKSIERAFEIAVSRFDSNEEKDHIYINKLIN